MKRIPFAILLLVSVIVSKSSVAQPSVWQKIETTTDNDKRLAIIMDEGVDAVYENTKRIPELINLSNKLAAQLNDERGYILAYNFKGIQFKISGNLDSALIMHAVALNKLRQLNYPELLAATYNNIGIIYKAQGQSNTHLAYLDSSLVVCRQHQLTKLENRYLMNKAYLIFIMGKPNDAIALSLIVVKRFNKPEDIRDKCVAYNNLGIFYRMIGSYDSAMICCKQAAKYAIENGLSLYLADAWCELGYIEQIKHDDKLAIKYIMLADSIYRLTDDHLGRYRVLTFKIDVYTKNKQYKEALQSVNELIVLANKLQNANWLYEAYKEKATLEELQGDVGKALKSFKQHLFWLDSFNTSSNNAKLNELEFKYQIRDKDKQLQILQKDAELHKQRQFLGYSIGVILLLVVLGIALYISIKAKNRKVMAEREKQQLLFQLEAQKEEIQLKSRQLTSKALYISERNELLEELLKMTKEASKKEVVGDLQTIERKIRTSLTNNKDWEEFKKYFEELNPDYLNRVKQLYTDLTERELRLMAFVKIGLNTKEIANILHVEPNSVKTARYRLKKKFNLDMDTSLEHFLNTI